MCPTEDAVVAALSFLPARPKLEAFVGVAVGVALILSCPRHTCAVISGRRYGLAPPLTRYLEMGGGADGTTDRDVERCGMLTRVRGAEQHMVRFCQDH